MVHQRVGTLSGGEKARLVLAMLVWQRPNLLLLDEPTNHLDLPTREALSIALNEFEGTVLLVSHDRALLREVCDEFWLVAGGHGATLRRRPGRLPALAARGLARGSPRPAGTGRAAAGQARRAPGPRRAAPTCPPGALAPCRRAPRRPAGREAGPCAARRSHATVARRDPAHRNRLARLATERLEVQNLLAAPGADAPAYADLGRRLAHIEAEVAMLEERWLELHAALESLDVDTGNGQP
jgi:ATP-binding cassette subfamily F protein 3